MAAASPRERVLAAFEMREVDPDISYNTIAKALSVNNQTIQRWFDDPKMDPYLDEIAIERAVKGDVPVYDALTHFEREVVLDQLAAKMGDLDFTVLFGSHARRIMEAADKNRERDAVRRRRAEQLAQPRPKRITAKRRGPEFDAKARSLRAQGKTMVAIATELGTSRRTVSRILADAA